MSTTGTVTPLTAVNYDDSLASEAVPSLFEGAAAGPDARQAWLERFEREVYGEMPAEPDAIAVARFSLAGEDAERVAITLRVADRQLSVDAALWLPAQRSGALPIILGLDFLGPVGTLFGDSFPIDPGARIPRSSGGRLSDSQRGITAHRWPVKLLTDAGYAVLTSCYGSWVPDDENEWQARGLWPLLLPQAEPGRTLPGAITLWSWAIRRLVDVAEHLPEIDAQRVAIGGHSRLGKAALLAAAHDTRIKAALVNNSGCLGASLTSRDVGETVEELRARFPHWVPAAPQPAPAGAVPLDQHHLLAAVAPRRLYVASASEDLWCDPKGEYLALQGASAMWPGVAMPPLQSVWREGTDFAAGDLGWHLRPGPHDIRPYDWRRFLRFLG